MALIIPGRPVNNWYQDISFSLEVMVSFVDGIERQAAESIVTYREKRRSEVIVENHPDGEFQSSIDVHQGLDSETWNLESVFRTV
jgi:hypothetical protein